MKYEVDISKLVRWLLPTFLQKPRMLAFMEALMTPVRNIYSSFLQEQEQMLNEVRLTGQTGVLENYLNDRFDATQRRIRILHVNSIATVISDARNTILSDVETKAWVLQDDTDIDTTVDFFIKIPSDFARNYQTVINNSEGNNRPWLLSDATATSLSDATPLNFYGIMDGYQALIISDTTPLIIYDLDDIKTTVQIRGIVEQYKISGKTYNLNI